MSEQEYVEILYFGYGYTNYDFINSQEMKDFLAKHDYLKIVIENYDEALEELSLPITEEYFGGPIMILDTRLDAANWEEHALLIHHQDDAFAVNPSPEFIEILKMMQAEYATRERELFYDVTTCDYEGERWNWEFDFTTGTYIKPAN